MSIPFRGPARDAEPRPSPVPPGLTAARLRRLLREYRPHRRLLLADLACAVVVAGAAFALPLAAGAVVRRLEAGTADAAFLLAAALALLVLVAVQAAAGWVVDFHGHMMGARIEARLRHALFDHVQRLGFAFHDRSRTGQLMSRIVHDSWNLGEMLHHAPEDLAVAVLKLGGVAAVLLALDPALALLALAAVPPFLLHALRANARMGRATRLAAERIAAVNEAVEDSLAGVRVVQSFGAEAAWSARMAALNARFTESRRFGYRSEALMSLGLDAMVPVATLLVLMVGAWRVRAASLDLGDLTAVLLAVAVMADPVTRLANVARVLQEGLPGWVRMAELLEEEPEVRDRPGAVALREPRGAVAFEGVSFAYPSGRVVLRDLSLAVRPGEFVALVGASGAGKSTLCALVPRFRDVTAGRVTVDGHDVRDLTLASLRRAVGVVPQDVHLFAGTVEENLRMARPDAPRAALEEAARAAGALELIEGLPLGWATDIGQRGVRLSGGQRQRLTLARAFLRDPAILILDEATSALDAATEAVVQEGIARLAAGRTVLVIAHRLSTIRRADRIVVLEGGRIAEEGPHEALLARGGAYAALVRAQARV